VSLTTSAVHGGVAYLYPSSQHALVKGPLVHAVSLSTRSPLGRGRVALKASGVNVNKQRRCSNETMLNKQICCRYVSMDTTIMHSSAYVIRRAFARRLVGNVQYQTSCRRNQGTNTRPTYSLSIYKDPEVCIHVRINSTSRHIC
jgi:hypothetical protein